MESRLRKNIFLTSLVAAALLAPMALRAADPLTLDGAVRQALAHNPDLGAVAEYRDAAASEARASRGARLPSVDLRHFVRRSDNPLDAFADKLNTRSVTAGWLKCTRRPSSAIGKRASDCSSRRIRLS